MRQLQINTQQAALPQLGILTHVDELANYDMIYIYHQLKNGISLSIEKDEKRTWDDNSLAVFYKGFKLGYVSKRTSGMIQKFIKQGKHISATIRTLNKEKYAPLRDMDIQIHVH